MTDTFSTWLLQQTDRDDGTGELARQAEKDEMFPQHGDRAIYEGYFGTPGTSSGIREEFERAWDEFDGLPG